MLFRGFCIICFAATAHCVMCVAADRATMPEWRHVREIQIYDASPPEQVGELIRQLGVRAIVDLGVCDWNTDEGAYEKSLESLPAFSFKGGTVKDALDEYCRTRPLTWHFWPEANAVYLEPKATDAQCARRYLERPLPRWELPRIGDIDSVVNSESVCKEWQLMASPGSQENFTIGYLPPENLQAGTVLYELLPDDSCISPSIIRCHANNSPKTTLEYVGWWLRACPTGVVYFKTDKPKGKPSQITLTFTGYPAELAQLPATDICQAIVKSGSPGGVISELLERELFRRSKCDGECLRSLLVGGKIIERTASELGQGDFYRCWGRILAVNTAWATDVIFSAFEQAPVEVQKRMIEKLMLPEPGEFGVNAFGPCEKLIKSSNKEFREWAEGSLLTYMDILKERKAQIEERDKMAKQPVKN